VLEEQYSSHGPPQAGTGVETLQGDAPPKERLNSCARHKPDQGRQMPRMVPYRADHPEALCGAWAADLNRLICRQRCLGNEGRWVRLRSKTIGWRAAGSNDPVPALDHNVDQMGWMVIAISDCPCAGDNACGPVTAREVAEHGPVRGIEPTELIIDMDPSLDRAPSNVIGASCIRCAYRFVPSLRTRRRALSLATAQAGRALANPVPRGRRRANEEPVIRICHHEEIIGGQCHALRTSRAGAEVNARQHQREPRPILGRKRFFEDDIGYDWNDSRASDREYIGLGKRRGAQDVNPQ
jgi:hypothetical protein